MEYAARRTIAELVLRDMNSVSVGKEIDEKELQRILNTVKETRKEIRDENEQITQSICWYLCLCCFTL